MGGDDQYQPSASLNVLKRRAQLLKDMRHYFDQEQVMEVETPMLSCAATVDPHIDSFSTSYRPLGANEQRTLYLHTSPEFPMKRLLACGAGDIYYLGRVFRNGEAGGRHNPEFTMLEYYRVGMTHHQLMDDMTRLLNQVCEFTETGRFTYKELFLPHVGVDPHTASDDELLHQVRLHIDEGLDGLSRNDCLDLLFSHLIEPGLGKADNGQLEGVYVYDYPASMAALSKIAKNSQGTAVAQRFELFIGGFELANGYHELADGNEQEARFQAHINERKEMGYPVYPYDEHLVTGLKQGNFPDCAGVAMGVDRLIMLVAGTRNIADVTAFEFFRA
ncbi:EF-P lysine aminoacylase EpmA [Spongorhabdus nitratireducens]